MTNVSGLLIGVLNIGIFVVIMLLVGVLIKYGWEALIGGLPANAEKLYMLLIGLVAITMLVALLLGSPLHYRFVGGAPFWLAAA